jgi:peptidoglycan/LPS O-acetylase OafA/YrhL
MHAYIVFPILLFFITTITRALLALAIFLLISVAYQLSFVGVTGFENAGWLSIWGQMPFFIEGILCFHIFRRLQIASSERRIFCGKAIFWGALAYWILIATWWPTFISASALRLDSVFLSVGLTAIVLSQVLHPSKLLVNRPTIFLGMRGYSIYLIHPVIVLFTVPIVRERIYGDDQISAGALPPYLLSCALVMTLTIMAATITYALIESPFMNMGKYLIKQRWVSAPATAPAE